jgi:hypothetical protein
MTVGDVTDVSKDSSWMLSGGITEGCNAGCAIAVGVGGPPRARSLGGASKTVLMPFYGNGRLTAAELLWSLAFYCGDPVIHDRFQYGQWNNTRAQHCIVEFPDLELRAKLLSGLFSQLEDL